MITAIMVNEDRISSHFTKADSLLLIDEQGQVVERLVNPALSADSKGKQGLVRLISQHAKRLVVRNIGERILEKLLVHNISVFQANSSRLSMQELANPHSDAITSLTEPSQGRPSSHYRDKQQAGCCNHGRGHRLSQGGRGNCQGNGHGNGNGHGHGHQRCCQS